MAGITNNTYYIPNSVALNNSDRVYVDQNGAQHELQQASLSRLQAGAALGAYELVNIVVGGSNVQAYRPLVNASGMPVIDSPEVDFSDPKVAQAIDEAIRVLGETDLSQPPVSAGTHELMTLTYTGLRNIAGLYNPIGDTSPLTLANDFIADMDRLRSSSPLIATGSENVLAEAVQDASAMMLEVMKLWGLLKISRMRQRPHELKAMEALIQKQFEKSIARAEKAFQGAMGQAVFGMVGAGMAVVGSLKHGRELKKNIKFQKSVLDRKLSDIGLARKGGSTSKHTPESFFKDKGIFTNAKMKAARSKFNKIEDDFINKRIDLLPEGKMKQDALDAKVKIDKEEKNISELHERRQKLDPVIDKDKIKQIDSELQTAESNIVEAKKSIPTADQVRAELNEVKVKNKKDILKIQNKIDEIDFELNILRKKWKPGDRETETKMQVAMARKHSLEKNKLNLEKTEADVDASLKELNDAELIYEDGRMDAWNDVLNAASTYTNTITSIAQINANVLQGFQGVMTALGTMFQGMFQLDADFLQAEAQRLEGEMRILEKHISYLEEGEKETKQILSEMMNTFRELSNSIRDISNQISAGMS